MMVECDKRTSRSKNIQQYQLIGIKVQLLLLHQMWCFFRSPFKQKFTYQIDSVNFNVFVEVLINKSSYFPPSGSFNLPACLIPFHLISDMQHFSFITGCSNSHQKDNREESRLNQLQRYCYFKESLDQYCCVEPSLHG